MKRTALHHDDWIVLLSEDARDETQRARLLERLEDGPARERYEFHLRLLDAAREAPMPASSQVYYDGVLETIHRRMPQSPAPARRRPVWRISRQAGASLFIYALMLFGVGFSLLAGGGLIDENANSARMNSSRTMLAQAPVRTTPNANPPRAVYVKGLGPVAGGQALRAMNDSELAQLGIAREYNNGEAQYVLCGLAPEKCQRGISL
ncbi:hypothetical protein JXA32_07780 [Candidatus Sumerlaeota bacterium]|nr:hypothetical protein [Candidatus Sumerlaeota bacterium]